ncbi:unnamed protein product [Dibothriocephalus latus]|uniref:Uncharacterized protein n=1 Tax=Dibothriocephalus latus TaxID=60516 RepID=A0A3P7NZC1_DIBLA|nr:unnamed protein product [Dibothriocephalus latus]
MLKLTVVCPACKYTFRAFDPFASLSLPLDVVLTNALIWSCDDDFQRIWCTIYVSPRCSLENLLYYFNLARKPNNGFKYVIAEINGRRVRILKPNEILNFRTEDYILYAFEVPDVWEGNVEMTTRFTNRSDSERPEDLCYKVITVINTHLRYERFNKKAKVSGSQEAFSDV